MSFAENASNIVPTTTPVVTFTLSWPLGLFFFLANFEHGVSFRTNRKSASTRFAGVDSLHFSNSLTTHSSSLSISLQFSSLMISSGRFSIEGIVSLKYFPIVPWKHSWRASCLALKHSGPSSAINTENHSSLNICGFRKSLLISHAIWFPFSWQTNSRRLLVILMKTTFCSFSSCVKQGSSDFVKASTQRIASPRLSQYLLKTVSRLPFGFAFSVKLNILDLRKGFSEHHHYRSRQVELICWLSFGRNPSELLLLAKIEHQLVQLNELCKIHLRRLPQKQHRCPTPCCISPWKEFWLPQHSAVQRSRARGVKWCSCRAECFWNRWPICWCRHRRAYR